MALPSPIVTGHGTVQTKVVDTFSDEHGNHFEFYGALFRGASKWWGFHHADWTLVTTDALGHRTERAFHFGLEVDERVPFVAREYDHYYTDVPPPGQGIDTNLYEGEYGNESIFPELQNVVRVENFRVTFARRYILGDMPLCLPSTGMICFKPGTGAIVRGCDWDWGS